MTATAKVGTASGIIGLAGLALYAFSPRVREREAALKIVRGELVDAHVSTGVKMNAILPHVDYIHLPKFLQRMTVSATDKDQMAVRTKEKAQVFGSFEVHYLINPNDPKFSEIYSRLRCDEIKDLEPFIKNYALPAIIDTYREVPTASVNNNLTKVGKDIAKNLQATLDEKGYSYIIIADVIPSGVGLSSKANSDLEQIVSEERKLDLQKVQEQVATNAVALTQKQTAVTIEALQQLREAGIPEDWVVPAYYMQLLRDTDRLGHQLVAGPIPGTGVGAVTTTK